MKKPNDVKRPNSNSGSLGQTLRARERAVHVSARAEMREVKNKDGVVTHRVPWVENGTTYDIGSSESKRIRREDPNPIRRKLAPRVARAI